MATVQTLNNMAPEQTKKTRKFTNVSSSDDDQSRWLIKKTAKDLLECLRPHGHTIAGKDFLALSPDNYQTLVACTSATIKKTTQLSSEEESLRKLLTSELLITAEKIERQCAGAGLLFARTFLQTLISADKLTQPLEESVATGKLAALFESLRIGLMKDFVALPSSLISKKTGRFFTTNSSHQQATSSAWHALNLAGLLGTVSVEKYKDNSGASETIIERLGGHRFRVDMMRTFTSSLSLGEFGTWDQREVKILIVDGVLNSVAEIDKVMLGASKDKQPTLIIASYFEEEVVATVAANNIAGRTNIFLGLLPRDSLDSVNMANDIAVCALSNPINSHSGHGMLSFLEYDALAVVDRVQVIPATNTMVITNPKAHGAVETQIRGLQEKLTELSKAGSDDKVREASAELINKRISNLISDKVVIKVPASKANVLIPKFDTEIRFAKSLLQYGQLTKPTSKQFQTWFTHVSKKDELVGLVSESFLKELGLVVKQDGVRVVGMTPYIVLWFASSLARQYLSTDYMVLTVRS